MLEFETDVGRWSLIVGQKSLVRRGELLMRAFAQAERFVSELESRKLRPAYVFVGDEAFFRKRFRDAILEHLVPR